jgi:hypothetical protein
LKVKPTSVKTATSCISCLTFNLLVFALPLKTGLFSPVFCSKQFFHLLVSAEF